MKIHIVGAGAIGGMAGWHMAKNGEDVTFVDQWLEHVEAMKEEGPQDHRPARRAAHPGQGEAAGGDRRAAGSRVRLLQVAAHRGRGARDHAAPDAQLGGSLAPERHERGEDRRTDRAGAGDRRTPGLHRRAGRSRPPGVHGRRPGLRRRARRLDHAARAGSPPAALVPDRRQADEQHRRAGLDEAGLRLLDRHDGAGRRVHARGLGVGSEPAAELRAGPRGDCRWRTPTASSWRPTPTSCRT